MRCAIYARVSTKDGQQDVSNQLVQLREFAAKQGWGICREYVDHASAKGTIGRREFQQMMRDAQAKAFDVLLVWALDRLSREGILTTFKHLETVSAAGVQFYSLTEPQFSGAAGELMLAIAAWIAKQERIRISERTKAGLARVRAKGVRLGAPLQFEHGQEAKRLHYRGYSLRQIAEKLGSNYETVRRSLMRRATYGSLQSQSEDHRSSASAAYPGLPTARNSAV